MMTCCPAISMDGGVTRTFVDDILKSLGRRASWEGNGETFARTKDLHGRLSDVMMANHNPPS